MHHPHQAWQVPRAFVSVHALRDRIRGFRANEWIMDSGAFTTIAKHGGYPQPPEVYAAHIRHWSLNGRMLAAVSQDYMCEPWMIERTGLSVQAHQALTIERYDALMACELRGAYLMPVLQGYAPEDYARHLAAYGDRLSEGAWVGVGSVCKRNGKPDQVIQVLQAIRHKRADLRLHGFGLKLTALSSPVVRALLDAEGTDEDPEKQGSADSMAWSLAGRYRGGGANDPTLARAFAASIDALSEVADQHVAA